MASDSYAVKLDEMIQLFQEYKSGSVTLDNITKLCQTLGLESFIDDIDSETSRLSTASKIIVIDIDFSKSKGRVKDVKLVLASNFDNFNYYNDPSGQAYDKGNILLNSLTEYPDLHEFHHNLKFLHLLDAYSSINIDASNTVGNGNFGSNNGSGNNDSNTTSNADFNGELDLFKYYTELAQFLRQYFADNSAPFRVETNMNNRFGIYILTQEGQQLLVKIMFQRSKDQQHRLYEYVYSEGHKEWTNESPESYTSGISLVMEVNDENCQTWFPRNYVPQELILDEGEAREKISDSNSLDVINSITTNGSRGKFMVMNDFTTQLAAFKKFDISNDNLDLILEILRWIQWSRTVLNEVWTALGASKGQIDAGVNMSDAAVVAATKGRRSSVATEYRKRRHSSKNKRPSISEATMLKEEGLQQFNLQELMKDQDIDPRENSALLEVDKMQVDDQAIEDTDTQLQLVFSEDHVSLENIAHCTLYDGIEKWTAFMEAFNECRV